jgi:predicted Zn-dependent protease
MDLVTGHKMRLIVIGAALGLLAGCAPVLIAPPPSVQGEAIPEPVVLGPLAIQNFREVVDRVEPVAEALCREKTRGVQCDLEIVVDDRPGMPANAFQTVDQMGRPIVGFTLALIADARNADELAFVMGHESAHHILGHIGRQQESAMTGALVAGVLASMSGADAAAITRAQDVGAEVAARSYSKEYELESDALGTEIAWAAGFDPVRGAVFFSRLPDPGDEFLGSHPPNAQRIALVRQTLAELETQR